MTNPEQRLAELGITLPGLLPAAGNYLAAKRHGDLVYVSGHGPLALDRLPPSTGEPYAVEAVVGALIQGKVGGALIQGKVGGELTLEEGREAARAVGLLILATLRHELGSLDAVRSIVKVVGMVNCAPGFAGTAAVVDGCSDLLVEVFGEEAGRHARSAPGVAELPFGVPVVIEMVVAVAPR
jgi:enamine deaminase RidA (YjgF/YER057c/UK114 family)